MATTFAATTLLAGTLVAPPPAPVEEPAPQPTKTTVQSVSSQQRADYLSLVSTAAERNGASSFRDATALQFLSVGHVLRPLGTEERAAVARVLGDKNLSSRAPALADLIRSQPLELSDAVQSALLQRVLSARTPMGARVIARFSGSGWFGALPEAQQLAAIRASERPGFQGMPPFRGLSSRETLAVLSRLASASISPEGELDDIDGSALSALTARPHAGEEWRKDTLRAYASGQTPAAFRAGEIAKLTTELEPILAKDSWMRARVDRLLPSLPARAFPLLTVALKGEGFEKLSLEHRDRLLLTLQGTGSEPGDRLFALIGLFTFKEFFGLNDRTKALLIDNPVPAREMWLVGSTGFRSLPVAEQAQCVAKVAGGSTPDRLTGFASAAANALSQNLFKVALKWPDAWSTTEQVEALRAYCAGEPVPGLVQAEYTPDLPRLPEDPTVTVREVGRIARHSFETGTDDARVYALDFDGRTIPLVVPETRARHGLDNAVRKAIAETPVKHGRNSRA